MLRYYEDEGLLEPSRSASGYRDYDAAAEETVRRVRMLVDAGLTLKTIRQLLPCVRSNKTFVPCDELRALLNTQVELLTTRIDALDQSRRILSGFLGDLTTGA
jgi:DNA-binding transcriptional MerR regulator